MKVRNPNEKGTQKCMILSDEGRAEAVMIIGEDPVLWERLKPLLPDASISKSGPLYLLFEFLGNRTPLSEHRAPMGFNPKRNGIAFAQMVSTLGKNIYDLDMFRWRKCSDIRYLSMESWNGIEEAHGTQ